MIRIGAIAASLNKRGENGKRRRKRTESEEEVERLKIREHTEIADIDIRENSRERLRFRKMPWIEVTLTMMFWAGALTIFLVLHFYTDSIMK